VSFILVETGVFSGRPCLLAFAGSCFTDCLAIFVDVFFVSGRTSVGLQADLLIGIFGRASRFRAIFLGAAVFLILEDFNPVFLGGFSLNLKTGSAAFLPASAFAALGRLARVGPKGGLIWLHDLYPGFNGFVPLWGGRKDGRRKERSHFDMMKACLVTWTIARAYEIVLGIYVSKRGELHIPPEDNKIAIGMHDNLGLQAV
jgi:hypothetical protein